MSRMAHLCNLTNLIIAAFIIAIIFSGEAQGSQNEFHSAAAVKPALNSYSLSQENETRVVVMNKNQVIGEYSYNDDEQDVIIEFEGMPDAKLQSWPEQTRLAVMSRQRRNASVMMNSIADAENATLASKGLALRPENDIIKREFRLLVHGVSARVHKETIDKIKSIPGVKKVWRDELVKAHVSESVPLIGANKVWNNLGITGKNVLVAVIDTGIDYMHPDLGGCIGAGCKVIGGKDFVNNDNDPLDDHGHGTHVAGIVAASGAIKGVAPDAKLMAVKVLNSGGSGSSSAIIAGIEYAVDPDQNPATKDGAAIINMSLGGSGTADDPMSQAVDNAIASGVLVCVSAGNSGSYESIGSPGLARKALTVGSSDKSNRLSYFSSMGPATNTWQIKPEVLAPGSSIYSTYLNSKYQTMSGTSMASPHVAGAAALLLERYPEMNPESLKQALIQRAVRLKDSSSQYYNVFQQGNGLIDVYASAALPGLGLPDSLSFGLDDTDQPSFNQSRTVYIANYGNSTQTYSLSATGTCPSGCDMSFSTTALTLEPGEKKSFEFQLDVNNKLAPNAQSDPFHYEGSIQAASGGETLRMPFAFFKANLLTLDLGETPTLAILAKRGGTTAKTLTNLESGRKILMGSGTFDLMAMFDTNCIVFQEGIEASSNVSATIMPQQAIYPMSIIPIGKDGKLVSVDRVLLMRSIKMGGISLISMTGSTYYGSYSRPTMYLSPVSSNAVIEMSMLANPSPSSKTKYTFHAAARDGVNSPIIVRNNPEDFRKVIHRMNVDRNVDYLYVRDSAAFKFSSTTSSSISTMSIGYNCSDTMLSRPFQAEAYYLPPPYPEFQLGYVLKDVYSLSGPDVCKAQSQLEYSTLLLRPEDTVQLHSFWFAASPIYSTSSELVNSGLGPYFWNGSFQNSSNLIYWNPVPSLTSSFVSQTRDVRYPTQAGTIPYELYQNDALVKSGNFYRNGDYLTGLSGGKYRIKLSMDNFYISGSKGLATVNATFDTSMADRNPPNITSFTLQRNGAIAYPLNSEGGEKFQLVINDDVRMSSVDLEYNAGDGQWKALACSNPSFWMYEATLPPAASGTTSTGLRIKAQDVWGNILEFETQLQIDAGK